MIVARVRRTLIERRLVDGVERVLVACSGGPDSAALLSLLSRLGPELGFVVEAASVDHGLRAGSAGDVAAARAQAEAVGVPFHALALSLEGGASLQARARQDRYRVLLELAAQVGAQRVATGHTRDDQAETVMMRLLRGTGLPGLAGIQPLRDDGVMRPLIDCPRDAVHAHARQAFTVPLAEDPSNHDTRFERVRVRKSLLPALRLEDAAVASHLGQLADDARAAVAALDGPARELLAGALEDDGALRTADLARAPTALRRLALAAWVRAAAGVEPGRAHLDALDRALSGAGSPEVRLPGGFRVRPGSAGQLRLEPAPGYDRDEAP